MLVVAALDLCRAGLILAVEGPTGQVVAPLVLGLALPLLAFRVHRRAVRLATLALAVIGLAVIGVLTVAQAGNAAFTVLNAATLATLIAMVMTLLDLHSHAASGLGARAASRPL
jgi:peptidoglycan/LPS O-acetylase OafA/YrhL